MHSEGKNKRRFTAVNGVLSGQTDINPHDIHEGQTLPVADKERQAGMVERHSGISRLGINSKLQASDMKSVKSG